MREARGELGSVLSALLMLGFAFVVVRAEERAAKQATEESNAEPS